MQVTDVILDKVNAQAFGLSQDLLRLSFGSIRARTDRYPDLKYKYSLEPIEGALHQ